jgi:hypothetical protein
VVVVVDRNNCRLVLWNLGDGTVWKRLGSRGTEPGRFNDPQAVEVTNTGTLVVTDQHRVQVLTVDGAVLCVLDPTSVAGVGQLGDVLGGVTVCPATGEILVTDFCNRRVVALTWSPPSQVRVHFLMFIFFSGFCISYILCLLMLRPVWLGAGPCRSVGGRAGLGQPGRDARAAQTTDGCGGHVDGGRVGGRLPPALPVPVALIVQVQGRSYRSSLLLFCPPAYFLVLFCIHLTFVT